MDPIVILAGTQLHPPNADGTGYLIDDTGSSSGGLTGWYGTPKPKVIYTAAISAAGSYFSALGYSDARTITIAGSLAFNDSATLLQALRSLAGICADPTQLYALQVTDDLGTLTTQVQRSGEILLKAIAPTAYAFNITLTAPDPRRYDIPNQANGSTPVPSTSSGLDWSTGGGLDFSTGGGLNWGTTTSNGVFTLTNAGTADSWPTFVLQGPLTNPAIVNQATGQQISYGGTLGPSDTVTITTLPPFTRTVTLNGTDRRSLLTSAQWFPVAPLSSLVVQLSTTSALDTGSVTGTINPAYW